MKIFRIITALFVATSILTGCGAAKHQTASSVSSSDNSKAKYIRYLGHGEEKDRGKKDKIIENAVEAFIGALFIA